MLEVKADMDARAAAKGRTLRYGWRSHVIVRETEDEARAAARRLLSKLDDDTGAAIRQRSLDSTSAGVRPPGRAARRAPTTRATSSGTSGPASGAPAPAPAPPSSAIPTRCSPRSRSCADAGIEAFILSGYPHAAECDLFARHVLPHIDHGPLVFDPDPVNVG